MSDPATKTKRLTRPEGHRFPGRQPMGFSATDTFRKRAEYLAERQAAREAEATGRRVRPNPTRAVEAAVYRAYLEEKRLEAAE
jgi:hypothetical protein